jgi:hypothetical protein
VTPLSSTRVGFLNIIANKTEARLFAVISQLIWHAARFPCNLSNLPKEYFQVDPKRTPTCQWNIVDQFIPSEINAAMLSFLTQNKNKNDG